MVILTPSIKQTAHRNGSVGRRGCQFMSARFWWANHSQTYKWEIEGSYLWFPKTKQKGAGRGESYRNMLRVVPGDVVFSFAEDRVGAVGVALGAARETSKPSELDWGTKHCDAESGWLLPVRFMPLKNALRPHEHESDLGPKMQKKPASNRTQSACNESVLLTAVPAATVAKLQQLLNGEVQSIVETITQAAGRGLMDDAAEEALQQRIDIGAAQKSVLIRARAGKGLFRENLEATEQVCRITGLVDRRHLHAVHIKPWCHCDDREKLDGSNGLLLSPHLADLFDRGYISFSDAGDLLVSEELNPAVLKNWNIEPPRNVGGFTVEQRSYLEFHRKEVFQHHGRGRRQKTVTDATEALDSIDVEPAIVSPMVLVGLS
jgi:putative restriction endonuclease